MLTVIGPELNQDKVRGEALWTMELLEDHEFIACPVLSPSRKNG